MKRILTGLLFAILLTSCTKQSDITVADNPPQQIVLRNPNISVTNVSAVKSGPSQVTFNFTTEYEKGIKSIEVLSGIEESLFCQIYIDRKEGNSTQTKNYTVVDNDVKGDVSYYMIKYTTTTGSWFCSSVYKVSLK